MQIHVFLNVTSCLLVNIYRRFESSQRLMFGLHEGVSATVFRNVGNEFQIGTTLHPRRIESSAIPLCESEVAGSYAISSGVKCCLSIRIDVRIREKRVEERVLGIKK